MKSKGYVVFLVLFFGFTMIFRFDSFQVSASGINQSEATILEPTQINEQSMTEELEVGCDPQDPACSNPGDTGSPGCDPQDPACSNPGDIVLPPCDLQDPHCSIPPCDPQDPTCPGGVVGDTSGVCDPEDPACEVPPNCDPENPACEVPPNCDPEDPACEVPPTDEVGRCDDGVDNDSDGKIDGDDDECGGIGGPPPTNEEGLCRDGIDNDGDGRTDSNDSDCGGGGPGPISLPRPPATTPVTDSSPSTRSPTDSSTAIGKETGLDVAIPSNLLPIGAEAALPREDNCSDGIDNNHNGLKDSEDPACVAPEISYTALNSSLGHIDLNSLGNDTSTPVYVQLNSSQINASRSNVSTSANGSNILLAMGRLE